MDYGAQHSCFSMGLQVSEPSGELHKHAVLLDVCSDVMPVCRSASCILSTCHRREEGAHHHRPVNGGKAPQSTGLYISPHP